MVINLNDLGTIKNIGCPVPTSLGMRVGNNSLLASISASSTDLNEFKFHTVYLSRNLEAEKTFITR